MIDLHNFLLSDMSGLKKTDFALYKLQFCDHECCMFSCASCLKLSAFQQLQLWFYYLHLATFALRFCLIFVELNQLYQCLACLCFFRVHMCNAWLCWVPSYPLAAADTILADVIWVFWIQKGRAVLCIDGWSVHSTKQWEL